MGLFRIKDNGAGVEVEKIFNSDKFDTVDTEEWNDDSLERLKEPGWESRYEYEAKMINGIINNILVNDGFEIKSVLELGSGPGNLSQKILEKYPNLDYHLVDKPFAKNTLMKISSKVSFL